MLSVSDLPRYNAMDYRSEETPKVVIFWTKEHFCCNIFELIYRPHAKTCAAFQVNHQHPTAKILQLKNFTR